MQKEISSTERARRAAISRWHRNPERIAKRFWSKVAKAGPSDCWIWLAGRNNKNYGMFSMYGNEMPASRAAFILTFGPIPDSLKVCHKCDNPPCCNPAHLFKGTQADNLRDMQNKGRKCVLRGEQGRHKLTESQVREIRAMVAAKTMPQNRIAALYGVHQNAICHIVKRRAWTHI